MHIFDRIMITLEFLEKEILLPHCSVADSYEGKSISNQPIPFQMDRDGHDFHALFQYMFYTWLQNCMLIESFFNKILNVRH